MSPEREATAAMAPAECTGAACRPRFWRESIHVRVQVVFWALPKLLLTEVV